MAESKSMKECVEQAEVQTAGRQRGDLTPRRQDAKGAVRQCLAKRRGSMVSYCITWGLRIVLGGLFMYAGAIKVIDPAGLLSDIEGYRLVPYRVAWAMSYYLPFLEILAGALLLSPRFVDAAAWILTGLMLVFTMALLSAWARGLDITCGCFGQTMASSNYPWLIFRDLLILTGLAAILGRLRFQFCRTVRLSDRRTESLVTTMDNLNQ